MVANFTLFLSLSLSLSLFIYIYIYIYIYNDPEVTLIHKMKKKNFDVLHHQYILRRFSFSILTISKYF